MDRASATTVFESLSSGHRLDAFRLLVKKGAEGLVAGEIGSALGLPPTNLSFHLKGLSQAGLVSVVQEGRYQRYRANLALMLDLVAYLTDECCGGHPEECAGLNPAVLCAEVALCRPSCSTSSDDPASPASPSSGDPVEPMAAEMGPMELVGDPR